MNWKQSFHEAARYSDPNRPLSRENCPHEERSHRSYRTANGRVEVRHQCLRCGDRGKVIPQAQVLALGLVATRLPLCEPDDNERYWDASRRDQAVRLEKWFAIYFRYMQSPEWRSIRERVLARDKEVCQGCLKEKAIEAHHLTYAHIGEEFLFELVAIGPRCQRRLRLPEDKIPG